MLKQKRIFIPLKPSDFDKLEQLSKKLELSLSATAATLITDSIAQTNGADISRRSVSKKAEIARLREWTKYTIDLIKALRGISSRLRAPVQESPHDQELPQVVKKWEELAYQKGVELTVLVDNVSVYLNRYLD